MSGDKKLETAEELLALYKDEERLKGEFTQLLF